MTGNELRAAREAAGMSQDQLAAAVGVTRKTVARAEAALGHVKVALADAVAAPTIANDPAPRPAPVPRDKPSRPMGQPETVAPHRMQRHYDFDAAPDWTKGLRRIPASNLAYGSNVAADMRVVDEGYQRVPGCCAVVLDSIPDPIPFEPPAWAQPRGVMTASGRVFDKAGHEMRPPVTVATDFARSGHAVAKGAGKAQASKGSKAKASA